MVEIVAEFTTNHLGSSNLLHRMVDAARATGAHSIKMQKKQVDTYYEAAKLAQPFASPYGKTYRDYRTMFEFNERDDWFRLDSWCGEFLPWFCTVQDIPSIRFIRSLGLITRYKIASSNARNWKFLEEASRLIDTDCEIVLSVAGSLIDEIETALEYFRNHRKIYLLHCVAEYPCPPQMCRLGNIPVLKEKFGCEDVVIGYSGHETGLAPSFAAIDLGAEMIERHFCISRHSFAHHIECSLEPNEFRQLVEFSGPERRARRQSYCSALPKETFEVCFGMSDKERDFLVDQKYGTKYLKDGSEM